MGLCCLLTESFSYDRGLPMSAAVTAAAVSATTTVEAATAANCSAADCHVRSTAVEAAHCAASCEAGTATSESATVKPAPKATSAEARTSVEAAVEPRASADEDATGKVARTVVTVRRAGIGVIPIVSVRADRSRPNVARTDAHADCDALSISVRR
jgi:hypothetical protein